MVVLVDLDDEAVDPYSDPWHWTSSLEKVSQADEPRDERPNPNVNGFSASLSCYPLVETAKLCTNDN